LLQTVQGGRQPEVLALLLTWQALVDDVVAAGIDISRVKISAISLICTGAFKFESLTWLEARAAGVMLQLLAAQWHLLLNIHQYYGEHLPYMVHVCLW
jgi:hypothetical protein